MSRSCKRCFKYIFKKKVGGSFQGSLRLEKYLNLEGFLEKSLKIKYAGKSHKSLEKSLISSIFCRN